MLKSVMNGNSHDLFSAYSISEETFDRPFDKGYFRTYINARFRDWKKIELSEWTHEDKLIGLQLRN